MASPRNSPKKGEVQNAADEDDEAHADLDAVSSRQQGIAKAAWMLEDTQQERLVIDYPEEAEARECYFECAQAEVSYRQALCMLLIFSLFETPSWCNTKDTRQSFFSFIDPHVQCSIYGNYSADNGTTVFGLIPSEKVLLSDLPYLPFGWGVVMEIYLISVMARKLMLEWRLQNDYFDPLTKVQVSDPKCNKCEEEQKKVKSRTALCKSCIKDVRYGFYNQVELYNAHPLYKNKAGAMIYFFDGWKISTHGRRGKNGAPEEPSTYVSKRDDDPAVCPNGDWKPAKEVRTDGRHIRTEKVQVVYHNKFWIYFGLFMVALEFFDAANFVMYRPKRRMAFIPRTGYLCLLPAVRTLGGCIMSVWPDFLSIAVFFVGSLVFYAWVVLTIFNEFNGTIPWGEDGTIKTNHGFDTFGNTFYTMFLAGTTEDFVEKFLPSYTAYRWTGFLWLFFLIFLQVLLLNLVLDTLVAAYNNYSEDFQERFCGEKVNGIRTSFETLCEATGEEEVKVTGAPPELADINGSYRVRGYFNDRKKYHHEKTDAIIFFGKQGRVNKWMVNVENNIKKHLYSCESRGDAPKSGHYQHVDAVISEDPHSLNNSIEVEVIFEMSKTTFLDFCKEFSCSPRTRDIANRTANYIFWCVDVDRFLRKGGHQILSGKELQLIESKSKHTEKEAKEIAERTRDCVGFAFKSGEEQEEEDEEEGEEAQQYQIKFYTGADAHVEKCKGWCSYMKKPANLKVDLHGWVSSCSVMQYDFWTTQKYSFLQSKFPDLWQSRSWQRLVKWVDSGAFDAAMNWVLLLNLVLVIRETVNDLQHNDGNEQPLMEGLELAFSLVYVGEISVKLAVNSWGEYTSLKANVFDFVTTWLLLATSLVELYAGSGSALEQSGLKRYMNILRLLRLIRMIKGLKRLDNVQFMLKTTAEIAMQGRDMLTFMGVVVYFFASLSVQLWGGKLYMDNPVLKESKYNEDHLWVLNFNDFVSAFGAWVVSLLDEYVTAFPEAIAQVSDYQFHGFEISWFVFVIFYIFAVAIVFELVKAFTIEVFMDLKKKKDREDEARAERKCECGNILMADSAFCRKCGNQWIPEDHVHEERTVFDDLRDQVAKDGREFHYRLLGDESAEEKMLERLAEMLEEAEHSDSEESEGESHSGSASGGMSRQVSRASAGTLRDRGDSAASRSRMSLAMVSQPDLGQSASKSSLRQSH